MALGVFSAIFEYLIIYMFMDMDIHIHGNGGRFSFPISRWSFGLKFLLNIGTINVYL